MDGLQWVAEIAFRHLWQALLIFVIVGVLLIRKDKWSAEHRSWIWAIAFFLMGVMPVATLMPTPGIDIMPSMISSQPDRVDVELAPLTHAVNSVYQYDATLISPVTETIDDSLISREFIFFSIIGVWAFFGIRALTGVYTAWRSTRDLRANAELLEITESFLPKDWPSYVTVAVSDRVNGPMALGLLRPYVLLPHHLIKILPKEQIRHVLAHELAHIERGDLVCAFGQRILLGVFWWSPFMHYACAKLRTEREMACDDRAARKAGCSRHYASSLLDSAEALIADPKISSRLIAVGAFESGKGNFFSQRIKRLINADYRSELALGRPHLLSLAGASAVIILLFVLSPRAAFSAVYPKNFEGTPYTQTTYPSTENGKTLEYSHHDYDYDTRSLSKVSKKLGSHKTSEKGVCCEEFIDTVYAGNHAKKMTLFRDGADLNCIEDDETALIAAINTGNTAAVAWLLENGADPNLEVDDSTPLREAVSHGHKTIVKKLLASGADPNLTAWGERTALFEAIRDGQYEMVKILAYYGADFTYVDPSDGDKYKAVEYANRHGQEKIAKYLKKYKVSNRG